MNDAAGASQVVFYSQLNNTPALTLALCAWLDIEGRGLGDGTMSVFSSSNALVGFAENGRDRVPAGVITFQHIPEGDKVWIYQGYVLPEYRGRGIYRAMWNELVLKSLELKVSKIEGATHVRNKAMRDVARKLGRTETHIVLTFDVPSAQ